MKQLNIAFFVIEFPALSETFVLNQIIGLLDMGHNVKIFSTIRSHEEIVQSDIERYDIMDKVHYFDIPQNRLARFWKAFSLLIRNFNINPLMLLKSLNPLIFGKLAISFYLFFYLLPFHRQKFDIIQCHFGASGIIGANLKKLGIKGKLVTIFHGADVKHEIEKGRKIYQRLFKVGDCFLVNSNYTQDKILRFGADKSKVLLHPMGIDTNMFLFQRPPSITVLPDPVIILTVARLVEEKGLKYGIQAIDDLLKTNPNINLQYRIIGDGPLESQLRDLVEQLNMNDVIQFLGSKNQDDVLRSMQEAHIFLLPSVSEGLGVVLLEAQSTGLPIIATSVGGIPQAVLVRKSGYLVSERDPKALSERLAYLIKHPQLWPEMGKQGRTFIEERYDINKLNNRLVQIYEALTSGDVDRLEKLRG